MTVCAEVTWPSLVSNEQATQTTEITQALTENLTFKDQGTSSQT
jgi:hypothetical protein